ncbi:MAG: acyl-ACP--UDP-N-acetylglucosamine O-acyltransferase [Polyangiales bacterium]
MIHTTAIVDQGAVIAPDVEIGPFCVVSAGVVLERGARLLAHVVVTGPTHIGARVVVHPFAVLGGPPQDRSYGGEPTELVIGDDAVIREHVTVHRGTRKDRGRTLIGARTLLMASVHVAHDVVIGDDCTVANASQLAGHVVLENGVTVGGAAAFAPFVRVGETAFIAAHAAVEGHVPPFQIAQGDRARIRAVNTVGLERRGVDSKSIAALKRAHRHLFRSFTPLSIALETLLVDDPLVEHLAVFLRSYATIAGPKLRKSHRDFNAS